ncbi:MAG: phenylalanine--tRNA ligase subunit beta, partial [Anaerolineae bacterium]|nr:phenylalanine--tRNA ligase subunit beta [Anaerolineae bacterium]
MRVPLSWLKEYVDIGDITVDELAERLTLAGLEVVGIERIGDWWDRDKIFVGQIVRVDPHPNADRLTLPTVEYGGPEPITVVTGAPNIRVGDAGQKVALALAGAVLIDGYAEDRRKTTLKPTKIRGVRSAGMVCSERELGLSDSHEGILILPDDAPVGMPLADYLGDVVLDLDLTPNLARCFSMIGVAREVAALLGRPLRVEEPTMEATGPSIEGQIDLEIADPDLCARYTAALIKGVKIGPSPWWMQRRLTLAGMRPINNIVDITNYVMLEWGQPLHAFDYHALRPRPGKTHPPAIIVRRARPGEKMTTLDGVERQLTGDMLLICDGAGPVAIAGVMGGLESEVTDQTTDILLESANFDAINNRRTAQALRMSTEASARFGRGIAPSMTVRAARRAAQLMRELAGGEIAQGLADLYPRPQETVVVTFTTAEVERILGVHMSVEEIVDILRRLEFQCRVEGETIHATVPDHRLDVRIPADIMEELARVYGYDRIPSTLLADELPPQRRFHQLETEEFIRDVLAGCGLQEVITYSLTSLEVEGRLYPEGESPRPEDFIRLANPLSSEREYLRRSLKASLLSTVASNLRHTPQVGIFEIAAVFEPAPGELLPREPMRLALAMAGPRQPLAWHPPAPENMD